MKKAYLFAALLAVALFTVSCTKPASESDQQTNFISPAATETTPESRPLTAQEEYIALVESYIDGASFQDMDESRIKQVSDRLMGHYDITGRTAGAGMDYYLAVRRNDAPVYNDFSSIDIGHISEGTKTPVLQIGYYDKDVNSNVLYKLEGYELLALPFGNKDLGCFCFTEMKNLEEHANPVFSSAFTQEGRNLIDFIKKNVGLSFYGAGSPCIAFDYQDEDTITFYSSPYPCVINLSSGEIEEISSLLPSSEVIESVKSPQEAWKYLHVKDPSIRSTGANLYIDGEQYVFAGNNNLSGYILHRTDGLEFIALEYNETVYRLVMDKIKAVMGTDYSSFDAQWFKTPLQSAEIEFPERVVQQDGFYTTNWRTQTITDPQKLQTLSELMDRAINSEEIYGFSKCPYTAPIKFVREDGQTLRIFIATDSCDSMAYDGRIGFQYGKQSEMAEIFDQAMAGTMIN